MRGRKRKTKGIGRGKKEWKTLKENGRKSQWTGSGKYRRQEMENIEDNKCKMGKFTEYRREAESRINRNRKLLPIQRKWRIKNKCNQ